LTSAKSLTILTFLKGGNIMSRNVNKQTIVYTLTDPENEAFKQVRRMNNVAADAKDEQLVAIGQAFAKLYPNAALTSIVLQQNAEVTA
jgi:hypothetical protein